MGKAQNVLVDFHKLTKLMQRKKKLDKKSVHYQAFKTPPTSSHAKGNLVLTNFELYPNSII